MMSLFVDYSNFIIVKFYTFGLLTNDNIVPYVYENAF